jgi:hypothetical protein
MVLTNNNLVVDFLNDERPPSELVIHGVAANGTTKEFLYCRQWMLSHASLTINTIKFFTGFGKSDGGRRINNLYHDCICITTAICICICICICSM